MVVRMTGLQGDRENAVLKELRMLALRRVDPRADRNRSVN